MSERNEIDQTHWINPIVIQNVATAIEADTLVRAIIHGYLALTHRSQNSPYIGYGY